KNSASSRDNTMPDGPVRSGTRKVSGWSLAACYFGIVGLLLPLLGLFFAAPAVVLAIVALLHKRQRLTDDTVPGDIRPLLGLIFGGLGTLIWGAVWLMILTKGI